MNVIGPLESGWARERCYWRPSGWAHYRGDESPCTKLGRVRPNLARCSMVHPMPVARRLAFSFRRLPTATPGALGRGRPSRTIFLQSPLNDGRSPFKFGRNRADTGRARPNLGQFRLGVGRTWFDGGQIWCEVDRIRMFVVLALSSVGWTRPHVGRFQPRQCESVGSGRRDIGATWSSGTMIFPQR